MDSIPLVSVIIPFYNRTNWTLQALNSVINQTYQNIEILLINDGSTESLDDLYSINDRRIKFIHQKNRGPASARNNGLRHAQGDFIAFLDSDDLFLPEKIEKQVQVHLQNPNVWLTHTSYQRFTSTGEILELMSSGRFSGNLYPGILAGCPIATPTVMINHCVVDKAIFYEENFRISEDIIFYSKIAQYSEFIGINIPYSLVRVTSTNHSDDPKCQITGYKNILVYLHRDRPIMSISEKKSILCCIYNNISYNYYLLSSPGKFLLYFTFACLYYPYFQKRIEGLNYPSLYFVFKKIYIHIRRVIYECVIILHLPRIDKLIKNKFKKN